jgi:hypothetical protein
MSIIDLKCEILLDKKQPGNLFIFSSIEIELINGIISYDKTKENEYIDISSKDTTNITSKPSYTTYDSEKSSIIAKETTETSEDIRVHDNKQYKLVIPKINGCTAMIIKSGDLTFIVHLEPSQINPNCFDKLFSYFREKGILEIDLFYSIKFGGALSIFMSKAKDLSITINKCINQDIYNYILRTVNVETLTISVEPKSYFLSYDPFSDLLLWYCDDNTVFDLDGEKNLYMFPNFFSREFILLISQIGKNQIKSYPDFNTLRSSLFVFIYFKSIFNGVSYTFENVTKAIKDGIETEREDAYTDVTSASAADIDKDADTGGGLLKKYKKQNIKRKKTKRIKKMAKKIKQTKKRKGTKKRRNNIKI